MVTCMSVTSSSVASDPGLDPVDGRSQRAPGQLVGQVSLVLGGSPVVGHR
jgi:hypothetical protein